MTSNRMTIRYEIPNSLVNRELKPFIASEPSLTNSEATLKWMEQKYLGWIEANIGEPEAFKAVTNPTAFDVEFITEDCVQKFLSTMGGKRH